MNFTVSIFMIAVPVYLIWKEAHILYLIAFACGMMLLAGFLSLANEWRKLL